MPKPIVDVVVARWLPELTMNAPGQPIAPADAAESRDTFENSREPPENSVTSRTEDAAGAAEEDAFGVNSWRRGGGAGKQD